MIYYTIKDTTNRFLYRKLLVRYPYYDHTAKVWFAVYMDEHAFRVVHPDYPGGYFLINADHLIPVDIEKDLSL
jgi:hypothetical protein